MSERASIPVGGSSAQREHYPKIGLLIDGVWIFDRPSLVDVVNPSNEAVLGRVPRATPDDLDRALEAAARGFEVWRRWTPAERSALLHKAAAIVRDRLDRIAIVITLEQGKPLPDARNEVLRAASFLDWDAEQILRRYGRLVPSSAGLQQTVTREPVGPVAAFTPWNVPISAPSRKISGALAAGCSIIIKPAEETPATTCLFAECFLEAGLPKGVLNVVHGAPAEVSAHLIRSPVIRCVTLTGSVNVGKQLSKLAAEGVKPSVMELGGHAPVLIDCDVDLIKVAKLCVGKFKMAGQICASPTRFIVHRDVYKEFVDAFARAAEALKVGDGFEPDVFMGPVINERRVAEMISLVDDALSHGARVATGGRRIGDRGFFYSPTVLADVPRAARAMRVEPFGPLALCLPMSDMEEGLEIANDAHVGLAGYLFTNSLERADLTAARMHVGMVSMNTFAAPGPEVEFGGVKESGVGREGGEQGVDAYMITKTIIKSLTRV
jgi:succinate-semialdehyde dehydrogenase/glutarate-semialdehyde dehydrogenase